jgi:hypothetical protein
VVLRALGFALFVGVVLLAALSGGALADEAVQTDWSGGGGVQGPVSAWGNEFYASAGASWLAIPGRLALSSSVVASPVGHLISDSYVGTIGVGVGDIDLDGDLDVVGSAQTSAILSWWENSGGDPPTWTEHIIGTPGGAAGVDVADIDGDGRPDVVLTMVAPRNKVVWKRNEGGNPITWGSQVIDGDWRDAWEIGTGDVDGDGNLDVMCTLWTYGDVVWWENDGSDPIVWTKHFVDDALAGAHSVRGADLDGDGDMDLAAAGGTAHKIVVYWSDGADSITWTRQEVETGFTGARSVWIGDIDLDGHLDIAGICWTSDIAWWSNDGGDPVVWTRQTVTNTAFGGHALCLADMNGNGRLDILGACNEADKISWWENGAGSPIVWTEHPVAPAYSGAISVRAGDVDGDGDLDPVGVAWTGGRFDWWEATAFDSSGELESSIYDSGIGASMGSIDWMGEGPPGTSLRFQVRSSNDPGDLGSWSGEITSPSDFPGVLDRYFQYRVLLETTDSDKSPLLFDVTLGPARAGLATDVGILESAGLKAEPNPFGSQVAVSFALSARGRVRLEVFDVSGRMVRRLADTFMAAGACRFHWDGRNEGGFRMAPGLYWLCLDAQGHRQTRGVVLLR